MATRSAATVNPNRQELPAIIRNSPLGLLLSDIRLFTAKVIGHPFLILLPLRPPRSIFADITPAGLIFQTFLLIISIVLLIPLGALGVLIGGFVPVLVATAVAYPIVQLQGDSIVSLPKNANPHGRSRSRTLRKSSSPPKQREEAWYFINGIATSRSGMLLDLQQLEKLFQRPIMGILNRSLGPLIDLLECIAQRDFGLHTEDVRRGYVEIREALRTPNIKRVVLLSHSQGGIIASLIVDELLATESRSDLAKLEVYSFANAANHFNNPKNALRQDTLRFVEHYANGLDPISQIGVLTFSPSAQTQTSDKDGVPPNPPKRRKSSSASSSQKDYFEGWQDPAPVGKEDTKIVATNASVSNHPFHGHLFVRWRASGHLLINHYLGPHNNILDTPEARRHSRLRMYLGGNTPDD